MSRVKNEDFDPGPRGGNVKNPGIEKLLAHLDRWVEFDKYEIEQWSGIDNARSLLRSGGVHRGYKVESRVNKKGGLYVRYSTE